MATPGLPPTMQFASLYVGDLHPDVSEAALYQAFQAAGNVASCRVCRDSVTRKSLCYGYVNYYNAEDAEKALEELNYTQINGRSCRVMWSQRDSAARKGVTGNIFVKNLDESIDNKALHDTFSIFGSIRSCKVALDSSGKSKGYGFVHYEAEEAAKQAIERVNGMQIGENTVFVGPFMKREELEGTGGPEEFTNLYVKNFPASWDEAKLNAAFKEHGDVVSSVIMANTDGKRFALVNYKEPSMAKKAIEALHRKDMRDAEADGGAAKEKPAETPEAKPADASEEKPAEASEQKPTEASEEKLPEASEEKPTEATEEKPAEVVTEKQEESAAEKSAEKPALADAEAAEVDAANAEAAGEANHPEHLLYVQRAQTRAERREMLIKERKQKGSAKERPAGVRLCVRNLGEDATSEELRTLFEPFGKVLSALVKTNESDGKCRGLGFVVLLSQEEATKAIAETHLKVVDGKPLNVTLAERRRQKGEQGGTEGIDLLAAVADDAGKAGKGNKGKGGGRGKGSKGGKGGKAAKGPASPPGPVGARPPLPPAYPYGLQPAFPPGMLPGLPPGYPLPGMTAPGALGRPAGPAGPVGPRPATYSLPPAMLGSRPVGPGTAPAPALGAVGTVPPGAFAMPPQALRPPFGYPQTALGAPGAAAHPALQPMMSIPQVPAAAMPPLMSMPPPGTAMAPAMARGPPAPPARPPLPNLTREALAALPPQQQKQQLGERLFPLIARQRPELAGKITGMMLELVNDDILTLLENERALKRKVEEAVSVLEKQQK